MSKRKIKKFGKKSIDAATKLLLHCEGTNVELLDASTIPPNKKPKRSKPHILDSKDWHYYAWVFNGKKSILYVDGKVFKKNMPMTADYWFRKRKPKSNFLSILGAILDSFRISKCARKIKEGKRGNKK